MISKCAINLSNTGSNSQLNIDQHQQLPPLRPPNNKTQQIKRITTVILDVIECFEYSNQSLKAGEITEKQKQLYKALDINPPQT